MEVENNRIGLIRAVFSAYSQKLMESFGIEIIKFCFQMYPLTTCQIPYTIKVCQKYTLLVKQLWVGLFSDLLKISAAKTQIFFFRFFLQCSSWSN